MLNIKKRNLFFSIAISLALLTFPMSVLAADTPSYWAVEQVNVAIGKNLVPQNLQSRYTQAITRAEYCALAVALYENIKSEIDGRITFSDTNDVNVQKAAAIGVVTGVGNNMFAPNDSLTREQAATMLSRLANALGKPLPKRAAAFADNNSIASWAMEAVGQVQAEGIMTGVGDSRFAPQGSYTREQSILTIARMFDFVTADSSEVSYKATIEKILQGETRNLRFGGLSWQVLDVQDGKALIITENIIETRPFNTESVAVTWETSSLRHYLNGVLLRTFSQEEQRVIIETRLSNPDNLWYGTPSGNDTVDKIFLLSVGEVDKYFGNSGDYVNKNRKQYITGTGQMVVNKDGSLISNSHDNDRIAFYDSRHGRMALAWWLRTTGDVSHYGYIENGVQHNEILINMTATTVLETGYIEVGGPLVNAESVGVRPVLWLNLEL